MFVPSDVTGSLNCVKARRSEPEAQSCWTKSAGCGDWAKKRDHDSMFFDDTIKNQLTGSSFSVASTLGQKLQDSFCRKCLWKHEAFLHRSLWDLSLWISWQFLGHSLILKRMDKERNSCRSPNQDPEILLKQLQSTPIVSMPLLWQLLVESPFFVEELHSSRNWVVHSI